MCVNRGEEEIERRRKRSNSKTDGRTRHHMTMHDVSGQGKYVNGARLIAGEPDKTFGWEVTMGKNGISKTAEKVDKPDRY